jgi:hypothetical protein
MYVINLKTINIGENFKLCVNCAIPTMSDNETMGKRGLSQCRQCHEVVIMELMSQNHCSLCLYIFNKHFIHNRIIK